MSGAPPIGWDAHTVTHKCHAHGDELELTEETSSPTSSCTSPSSSSVTEKAMLWASLVRGAQETQEPEKPTMRQARMSIRGQNVKKKTDTHTKLNKIELGWTNKLRGAKDTKQR